MLPIVLLSFVTVLTICSRSLVSGDRTATLEDFVLRIGTKLASLVPGTTLGMVFDLINRYSSPGCLLFFLNVPHNMFAMWSRAKFRQIAVIQSRRRIFALDKSSAHFFSFPIDHSRILPTLGQPLRSFPRAKCSTFPANARSSGTAFLDALQDAIASARASPRRESSRELRRAINSLDGAAVRRFLHLLDLSDPAAAPCDSHDRPFLALRGRARLSAPVRSVLSQSVQPDD